jgi:predicted AAA+ superfamily ATPase
MIKDRDLYHQVIQHLDKKEYSIIIGARQVGKTTLIQQLYTELKKSYSDVYYISLENSKILHEINVDPENLFHYARHPENPLLSQHQRRIIVFIDEIQYAENPSNFLKYLFDTYQQNLKIIATGSSAFYLDIKFTDSLAGRKRLFHLKPLSFPEFLSFKDAEELRKELNLIREDDQYISSFYNDLLFYFNEYLTYRGYPRVALEKDNKEKYLEELINSFLKKDIYESKIEQELKFYNLCALLAAQAGQLLNKNELSGTLGLNQRTLEKYLYVLQKCFYVDLLPAFYQNLRKEITKMPKVYFHDLGIRNKLLNRFHNFIEREDKGQLIENYIFIRLGELYSKDQIRFWRTADKNEVDFIVTETFGTGKAYEIKFSDKGFRHSSYKTFQQAYPGFSLNCIAYHSSDNSIPILKI